MQITPLEIVLKDVQPILIFSDKCLQKHVSCNVMLQNQLGHKILHDCVFKNVLKEVMPITLLSGVWLDVLNLKKLMEIFQLEGVLNVVLPSLHSMQIMLLRPVLLFVLTIHMLLRLLEFVKYL